MCLSPPPVSRRCLTPVTGHRRQELPGRGSGRGARPRAGLGPGAPRGSGQVPARAGRRRTARRRRRGRPQLHCGWSRWLPGRGGRVMPGAGGGPRKAAWAVRGTGAAEPPPRRRREGGMDGGRCQRRVPARAAERRGAVSAAGGRSRQPGCGVCPPRARSSAGRCGDGAGSCLRAAAEPGSHLRPPLRPLPSARLSHARTLPRCRLPACPGAAATAWELPRPGSSRRGAAKGPGGRLGKLFAQGSCRCHAEFSAQHSCLVVDTLLVGKQSKKA